jgi:hypothetical protein
VVTQLAPERFALTHVQGTLKFVCSIHTSATIPVPEAALVGSLEVTLPCDCVLISNGEVLIRELYPCDAGGVKQIGVVHILPSGWAQLNISEGRRVSYAARKRFDNLSIVLDDAWTLRVPHFASFARYCLRGGKLGSSFFGRNNCFAKSISVRSVCCAPGTGVLSG